MIRKLVNGVERIENLLILIAAVLVVALMFLVSADVIGREVLNRPIQATVEIIAEGSA